MLHIEHIKQLIKTLTRQYVAFIKQLNMKGIELVESLIAYFKYVIRQMNSSTGYLVIEYSL